MFIFGMTLLLMANLNVFRVAFSLWLLRFGLPSRLPMMFILWIVVMMNVIIPSKGVYALECWRYARYYFIWFCLTISFVFCRQAMFVDLLLMLSCNFPAAKCGGLFAVR